MEIRKNFPFIIRAKKRKTTRKNELYNILLIQELQGMNIQKLIIFWHKYCTKNIQIIIYYLIED
ncbi:hypothetical protein DRQ09_05100 [candidate division KSB1 bacterium]|nr:MAG: hypothetical protein DRQ09_05100 [candidate division KSB1 bacterium]